MIAISLRLAYTDCKSKILSLILAENALFSEIAVDFLKIY